VATGDRLAGAASALQLVNLPRKYREPGPCVSLRFGQSGVVWYAGVTVPAQHRNPAERPASPAAQTGEIFA